MKVGGINRCYGSRWCSHRISRNRIVDAKRTSVELLKRASYSSNSARGAPTTLTNPAETPLGSGTGLLLLYSLPDAAGRRLPFSGYRHLLHAYLFGCRCSAGRMVARKVAPILSLLHLRTLLPHDGDSFVDGVAGCPPENAGAKCLCSISVPLP